MTYIIAEPCIDIKDRSCVDVCPVDCIHEADRILVIDPEECIDCFAADELFFTTYGLRSFAEMENRWTRVLTDDGFKPAYIRRFRRKPLVEIELAPAFEERDRYGGTRLTTRNISSFRRTVHATPTHSWVLADGDRTSSLEVGQFVPSARLTSRCDNTSYRDGVLHGLVFGDGSCGGQVRSDEYLHYVPLFGERAAAFRDYFERLTFSRSLKLHPGYAGTGVVYAPCNLKRNLPADGEAEYIAGFIRGWLAADGDRAKAGSWRLRSTEHEALEWAARVAPLAGYVTIGSGEESNTVTSYGRRNRSIRWLCLATRETYWRVMRVTPVEQDDDFVFCAVVPGKHAFTLAGGLTTGNCGACEPECPVEAIFPEDALPDKWNAFVEINYAYGKGMDVVNQLTEKYAVDNDVHNEPIE